MNGQIRQVVANDTALIRMIRVGATILQEFPVQQFTARELWQKLPPNNRIPLSTLYRYLLIFEREHVVTHEGCQYALNRERYRALLQKSAYYKGME